MATVLPGSPPSFDKDNEAGTVRAICNYLRNMHDNVDFQLGQIKKTLEAQQAAIALLTEKNTGLRNEISALREDHDKLAARVSTLKLSN